MLLSDAFPRNKSVVAALKHKFNITTVEQALAYSDYDLLGVRNVGKIFVHRLRKLGEQVKTENIVFRPQRKNYVLHFTYDVRVADTMSYVVALELYCNYLESKIPKI